MLKCRRVQGDVAEIVCCACTVGGMPKGLTFAYIDIYEESSRFWLDFPLVAGHPALLLKRRRCKAVLQSSELRARCRRHA